MTANKWQSRIEELKSYLGPSCNRVIYHRLTRGDRARLFKPLKFFNQLYDLYSYATANPRSSSTLAEKLKEIDLKDGRKSFLLHYLDILFLEESIITDLERHLDPKASEKDTTATSYQIDIFVEWAKLLSPIDHLRDYQDSVTSKVRDYLHKGNPTPGGDELMKSVISMAVKQRFWMARYDRYDFSKVRQQLRNLPDNETRIVFLDERKIEYLQLGAPSYLQLGATAHPPQGTPREYWSKEFDQKCEMEKAKLKGLIEIYKPENRVALTQNEKALPLVDDGSSAKATNGRLNDGSSAKATNGRQYISLTDGDWKTICEMYSDHLAREQERLSQRKIYDKLTDLGRIRMGFRTFQTRCSARGWPPLPEDKQT